MNHEIQFYKYSKKKSSNQRGAKVESPFLGHGAKPLALDSLGRPPKRRECPVRLGTGWAVGDSRYSHNGNPGSIKVQLYGWLWMALVFLLQVQLYIKKGDTTGIAKCITADIYPNHNPQINTPFINIEMVLNMPGWCWCLNCLCSGVPPFSLLISQLTMFDDPRVLYGLKPI